MKTKLGIQISDSCFKVDGLHGGYQFNNAGNEGIKAKYDRKSFYVSEFLKLKEFPSMNEIVLLGDDEKHSKFTIIKFDVDAVRLPPNLGLLFSTQKDFLHLKNVYMFEFEFKQVFSKEFRIIKMSNVSYLEPAHVTIDKGLTSYLDNCLKQKEKYDVSQDNPIARESYKTKICSTMGACASKPNGNLDSLGYTYLQAKCRLEMYKTIQLKRKTLVSVFVDEIHLTKEDKKLENDKKWRTST